MQVFGVRRFIAAFVDADRRGTEEIAARSMAELRHLFRQSPPSPLQLLSL
jgi:hypothetical protein